MIPRRKLAFYDVTYPWVVSCDKVSHTLNLSSDGIGLHNPFETLDIIITRKKSKIGCLVWVPSSDIKDTGFASSQNMTPCLAGGIPTLPDTVTKIIPAHLYYKGCAWGEVRSLLNQNLNQSYPLSLDLLALIVSMHPHEMDALLEYIHASLEVRSPRRLPSRQERLHTSAPDLFVLARAALFPTSSGAKSLY